jgi:hypothetical protein
MVFLAGFPKILALFLWRDFLKIIIMIAIVASGEAATLIPKSCQTALTIE